MPKDAFCRYIAAASEERREVMGAGLFKLVAGAHAKAGRHNVLPHSRVSKCQPFSIPISVR